MHSQRFEYGQCQLENMIPVAQAGTDGADLLNVQGQTVEPTERFWTSLFKRYGLSRSILKLFDLTELAQRMVERRLDTKVRYTIEFGNGRHPRLLALANPKQEVLRFDDAREMLAHAGTIEMYYDGQGQITSTHIPRAGTDSIQIGPDHFQHQYIMCLPIDGWGRPTIYLSMLREVCSNGMVGWSNSFRSQLEGDPHSVQRVLECFNNGDGYSALRQRIDMSQRSWASVHEANRLYRSLVRVTNAGQLQGQHVLNRFHQMTGDISLLYGIANAETLSAKQQRTLPVKCHVYDLLNFASELATHQAQPAGAERLQAYIGSLLSNLYDLEGTAEVSEFDDFFLEKKVSANVTGS